MTHQQPFGVKMCSALLKHLLLRRHQVSWRDLRDFDGQLFRMVKRVMECSSDEEIQAFYPDLNFECTVAERDKPPCDVPLMPGGSDILVTKRNRSKWSKLFAETRIFHQIGPHVKALARGFSDILPPRLSRYLSVDELKLLLQGPETLDVSDFKKHVVLGEGYHANSQVVRWFWEMVEGMNPAERRELLLFWSGSPVPPVYGFDARYNENGSSWAIHKAEGPTRALPSASTCMYLLKIPPYPDRQCLRSSFRTALKFGSQGYHEQ